MDDENREWWISKQLEKLDSMFDTNNDEKGNDAMQFRIWARGVLKEYILKGFVMDDERLKGNHPFDADYFVDLQERIREIRMSERSNCQKITDIYAEFSCDYSPEAKETKAFYLAVRNMMQYDNELNAFTTALLDIAEDRARRHIITTMAEWKKVFSHLHKHGFHEQE